MDTQASRNNDQGFFYQLCKANGQEVSVTNWTFGGHSLGNLFDGACEYSSCPIKGASHETYLIDRYYDYVIVSPGGGTAEQTIAEDFDYITNFFKAANPDVKIVCLGNLGAHSFSSGGKDLPGVYNYYKTLEEKGVIIADWGGLVWRVLQGIDTVPGATQDYVHSTFIVKDGYHPNALSGYITALMAYCAITGEAAEGQPYAFCSDTKINAKFNMKAYALLNYVSGITNFDEVLASPADMKGIQQLVDTYLAEKPYQTPLDKMAVEMDTVMLTEHPKSPVVSVIFSNTRPEGNAWRSSGSKWALSDTDGYRFFSGIRGDADAVASLEGTVKPNGLTDAQKKDLADIRYGISVIGLSHMELTKYSISANTANESWTTSLANLINGHYGTSYPSLLYFDHLTYNIQGEEDASAPYTALLTLNFGESKTFEAIGYAAGNLVSFPQAQDVYVSDDGVNWKKVPSACFDTYVAPVAGIEDRTDAKDPWNNNTPTREVLFDMQNVSGKYIRIGIIRGARDSYHGMTARELLVFGK